MSARLIVTYADHQHGYFNVPEGQGWRIDAAVRCIVIGQGVPRKMVPLDGVQVIEVVTVEAEAATPTPPPFPVGRVYSVPVAGGYDNLPWVLDDAEQADDPLPPLTALTDVLIGQGRGDVLLRRGQPYTCFTRAARESLLFHGYAEERR